MSRDPWPVAAEDRRDGGEGEQRWRGGGFEAPQAWAWGLLSIPPRPPDEESRYREVPRGQRSSGIESGVKEGPPGPEKHYDGDS